METLRVRSNEEVGAAIRLRRRELELSQDELAQRLNVSYQQVQRYEAGKNIVNVEILQLLAHALRVSLTYFFCRTSEPETATHTAVCRTADEAELLSLYRSLTSKEKKTLVLGLARLAAPEAVRNEDADRRRETEPLSKTRIPGETAGEGRLDSRFRVSVSPQ